MAPRSAFVTGGTGFVGLNLIEQLVGQGWAVTALHRPTSDLRAIRRFPVRLVAGDLLDPASLRRAIPESVDALFHLAADISVWSKHAARQTRINVEGTRNVVDAALAAGVRRMVHTSTGTLMGSSRARSARSRHSLAAAPGSTTTGPSSWPRRRCGRAWRAGWTR